MYTVITENDESKWKDITGVIYSFPKKYLKLLQSGTKVVYYKGKLKNNKFKSKRLSDAPHYFGCASIGDIFEEKDGKNISYYASINDYIQFDLPVPFKVKDEYIEKIPSSMANNYWRDGVRSINEDIYLQILKLAGVDSGYRIVCNNDFSSYKEGSKKEIFTTRYERNSKLRKDTLEQKGAECKCCGFSFEKIYGELGKNYIHIHHTKPLYLCEGKKITVSVDDMEPVCPNCHAMIHKNKKMTYTIEEIRNLILRNEK